MKKLLCTSLASLVIIGFALTACKKNNESSSRLMVRLTDAPVNFQEVNVDIQQVRVKFSDDTASANGWVDLATKAGIYNLLGFQNGVDTLLASGTFPLQIVKEIRFILGPNNTIKDNNIVYPLTIPSGSESGLKIKVNKSLQADLTSLIIDFDAALSVTKEGPGDYKLRPVLKIK